jgi:hypothetical protein
MSLRADMYRQKAAQAKESAAKARNPSMKRAFEEVAAGWLVLAEQMEWIDSQKASAPQTEKIRASAKLAHVRNYNQFNRRIGARIRSARVGIPSRPLTKKAASPPSEVQREAEEHWGDGGDRTPSCRQPMKLVRTIPRLGGLPALFGFYCGPCNRAETIEHRED